MSACEGDRNLQPTAPPSAAARHSPGTAPKSRLDGAPGQLYPGRHGGSSAGRGDVVPRLMGSYTGGKRATKGRKKHKFIERADDAGDVLNSVRSASTRAAELRLADQTGCSTDQHQLRYKTSSMSLQLEENVPSTEEEEEDDEEEEESDKRSSGKRSKASAPSSGSKKKNKKKNQPGRYSQLVVDTIRKLGERNGSSLAKIYGEAKTVSWFDQQNGRTYLKYSVKALVQNDTLVQVKGVGANGSFRLNKRKLEGGVPEKKAAPDPKPVAKKVVPKKNPKKAKPKKETPKESTPKPVTKKAASSGGKKVKKAGKPGGVKVHRTRRA